MPGDFDGSDDFDGFWGLLLKMTIGVNDALNVDWKQVDWKQVEHWFEYIKSKSMRPNILYRYTCTHLTSKPCI